MTQLAVFGGLPARTRPYPPWPDHDDRDEAALLRVLRSRRWGGWPYPGPETAAFLDEFLALQGGQHAIACANGTVTMEVALRAAGIGWGDEVIVPAYTFQATAVAPLMVGATPVLVDVDPENYCLAPEHVASAITARTRAVIVVHVGHEVADLDAIGEICRRHDLLLIEDAAHAHAASWRGSGAGTWGHFGSFSLQSNKLLTTGEGGILICSSAELARRAASIADNGRPYQPGGRARGGELYTMGSNMRMTEFQAALGRVGLERLPEQTARRAEAASYLDEILVTAPGVRLLRRDARHTRRAVFGYVFAIDADAYGFDHRTVCHLLNSEGIPCWSGYQPLHRDPLFRPLRSQLPLARSAPERLTFDNLRLPVSEQAAREAVWLREQVFRDGRSGVEDVVAALNKLHDHRHAVIPRQHEFQSESPAESVPFEAREEQRRSADRE